jgi:hypothetical protein
MRVQVVYTDIYLFIGVHRAERTMACRQEPLCWHVVTMPGLPALALRGIMTASNAAVRAVSTNLAAQSGPSEQAGLNNQNPSA